MQYDCLDVPFEDIEVKGIKAGEVGEEGIFTGYGSTFGGKPDLKGDIIVKGAFTETLAKGGYFGNGIAMLWQHSSDEIPGIWTNLSENERGLKTEGKLLLSTNRGKEAYELLKANALKGLSIGFTIPKPEKEAIPNTEYDDKRDIRYIRKIDLWEVSLVTFPANPRAGVLRVKEATDARSLEKVLRDAGLSRSEAKYVVSLCQFPSDETQRDAEATLVETGMDLVKLQELLIAMKTTNKKMDSIMEVING